MTLKPETVIMCKGVPSKYTSCVPCRWKERPIDFRPDDYEKQTCRGYCPKNDISVCGDGIEYTEFSLKK